MKRFWVVLGLEGGSITAILARYRHAFLVLTFVSLGFSFYLNYIKVHAHFISRIIFWLSVFIALGIVFYSYFVI